MDEKTGEAESKLIISKLDYLEDKQVCLKCWGLVSRFTNGREGGEKEKLDEIEASDRKSS